jgi:hypothetical protein
MSRLDRLRRLLLGGVSLVSLNRVWAERAWAEFNRSASQAPAATVWRGPAAQLRNLRCSEGSARSGSTAHSTGLSAH